MPIHDFGSIMLSCIRQQFNGATNAYKDAVIRLL